MLARSATSIPRDDRSRNCAICAPDPLVELNPKDAETYGIKAGDWVRIENPWGLAFLKAKVTPIIKEGYIQAQHGWWFPEEDAEAPHLYGVWKSNINTLIPHSRMGKLGFGAPFRTTLVKISKAHEDDLIEPIVSDSRGEDGQAAGAYR